VSSTWTPKEGDVVKITQAIADLTSNEEYTLEEDSEGTLFITDDAMDRAYFSNETVTILLGLVKPATAYNEFAYKVDSILGPLKDLLVAKNAKYGNSALEPVRIFSKASAIEQILVRLDTKINRLSNNLQSGDSKNDSLDDLLGYLVLLKIAIKEESQNA